MSAQALGGDEENAYGAQISGFTRHRLPLHRSQPQPSSRPWGVKRPLCHPLWALTLPLEQARGGHLLTAGECPAHLFGGLNLEHPKDEGGMLCSDHGTLGSLWSLQETKPSGRKSGLWEETCPLRGYWNPGSSPCLCFLGCFCFCDTSLAPLPCSPPKMHQAAQAQRIGAQATTTTR